MNQTVSVLRNEVGFEGSDSGEETVVKRVTEEKWVNSGLGFRVRWRICFSVALDILKSVELCFNFLRNGLGVFIQVWFMYFRFLSFNIFRSRFYFKILLMCKICFIPLVWPNVHKCFFCQRPKDVIKCWSGLSLSKESFDPTRSDLHGH